MPYSWLTIDGNEAAASVAYRLSEVVATCPGTSASPMGELSAAWSAEQRRNLWGTIPRVVELQSEAGAAGTVHGAIQAGALATLFTASQGLLLMLPNMFKIAGELTPAVIHVAARAVATHALSISGDHSDVMAARSTGWAMLCAGNVQEAHDFALISHAATLETRIPFVHFFDGFRTAHEIARIAALSRAELRAVIDDSTVAAHRSRALTPDHPVLRGTAPNPDVFFQGREAANPFYESCAARVQRVMDRFASAIGRRYALFDYVGSADADRVIVMMGSGAGAAAETVSALRATGQRVGLLKVRLFRPFSAARLIAALPSTVRAIAVLDRTKEPGAAGEPLYQDVVTAIAEARASGESPFHRTPRVTGGRYGLGSKEFTPAMVEAVFHELTFREPTPRFSVGIIDDVSFQSLPYDDTFAAEPDGVVRALVYSLMSGRTVSDSKNTIKVISDETGWFAQAYFVDDVRKAGAATVSHLRFGPRRIESSYLIDRAQFVACWDWELLARIDILEHAAPGATVLLNVPCDEEDAWARLPAPMREQIVSRRLKVYAINAAAVASSCGLGRHVNTILQTCVLAISGIVPRDRAVAAIKDSLRKTYASKGDAVVQRNEEAVDRALALLHDMEIEIEQPARADVSDTSATAWTATAPRFVRGTLAPILAGEGDAIPVSLLPADGTYPVGTSKWEKRNLANEIPVWQEDTCIQCGKCAFVCPHASIRIKVCEPECLAGAPAAFKSIEYRGDEYAGMRYTIQVAPEDCTGCRLCVEVCPARDTTSGVHALDMQPQRPLRETERENFAFFLGLPELDRSAVETSTVKGSQFLQPLFEFPDACVGCGVTPYLKLVSQLFGDRMVVANATGCSSIVGGHLSTPWTRNREGRGPAWSHSLSEDNAEFGYGMRVAIDARTAEARELLASVREIVGGPLADGLLGAPQASEADIHDQRQRVELLRERLEGFLLGTGGRDTRDRAVSRLLASADYFVKKSVWLVGGEDWAYDTGYGGLDHVLASVANVNVLVFDTDTRRKSGGHGSTVTPRSTIARDAASAKAAAKKGLGLLGLVHRHVYVAHVALGADDTQTVRALLEAESYDGPSLVIAYAHCTAHGIEMDEGLEQQRRAVACGHWPLFRYDPRRASAGEHALVLDSRPPLDIPVGGAEARFRYVLEPDAAALPSSAQDDLAARWQIYSVLAGEL